MASSERMGLGVVVLKCMMRGPVRVMTSARGRVALVLVIIVPILSLYLRTSTLCWCRWTGLSPVIEPAADTTHATASATSRYGCLGGRSIVCVPVL